MSFNYAKELKIWKAMKEAEEKVLREAGVSEEKIKELYAYDWNCFKAERAFRYWEFCSDTYFEEYPNKPYQPIINEVDDLLDDIESPWLYQELVLVGKQTMEIVLMKMQGYSTHEIAEYFGLSEKAIYRRIDRFREKIKNNID